MTNKIYHVVLSLPHIERKDLVVSYRKFISKLDKNIPLGNTIILLGSSQEYEQLELNSEVSNRVELNCDRESIFDIWIRDYAPIIVHTGDSTFVVKQVYYPAYYYKKELKRLKFSPVSPQPITKQLCQFMLRYHPNVTTTETQLILDGGNFIANTKGDVIISTRIFADNPSWSKLSIEKELNRTLGVERVFFIGCEPGDETGHVDSIVRFVTNDTILVSQLSDEYISSKSTIKKKDYIECRDYLNAVAEELSHSFHVIRLTDLSPSEEYKEGIPSAYGSYLNYFQFNNLLFVPQYNQPKEDQEAIQVLEKAFHLIDKLEIIPVDCITLSSYGGVLNCITCEF
jgi:agmatine/peptidylarginine deiminase